MDVSKEDTGEQGETDLLRHLLCAFIHIILESIHVSLKGLQCIFCVQDTRDECEMGACLHGCVCQSDLYVFGIMIIIIIKTMKMCSGLVRIL